MESKNLDAESAVSGLRTFPIAVLLLAITGAGHEEAFGQEIPDNGNFKLEFLSTDDPTESKYRNDLKDSGRIAKIVRDINCELNVREDVRITFRTSDSGSNNPIYDVDFNQILISYGFVSEVSDLFEGDHSAWLPNVEQILLHEMAHALIDVNRIEPIYQVENSEVLADELAFFVMSEFYDADEELKAVADHFALRTGDRNALNALSGKHLPDQERANQYICWINGKRRDMAGERGKCWQKYDKLLEDWDDRLAPSWKKLLEFESNEFDEDDYLDESDECDEFSAE